MDIFAAGERLLEKQKQKLEQEKRNREFNRPYTEKERKQAIKRLRRSEILNERCENELATDAYVMLDERTVQIWVNMWLEDDLRQSTWWMKPHR